MVVFGERATGYKVKSRVRIPIDSLCPDSRFLNRRNLWVTAPKPRRPTLSPRPAVEPASSRAFLCLFSSYIYKKGDGNLPSPFYYFAYNCNKQAQTYSPSPNSVIHPRNSAELKDNIRQWKDKQSTPHQCSSKNNSYHSSIMTLSNYTTSTSSRKMGRTEDEGERVAEDD